MIALILSEVAFIAMSGTGLKQYVDSPHQLLLSDAAEDGDGDGTVGTGGNFPAEDVALKFVCAHLSGVVIVRKR